MLDPTLRYLEKKDQETAKGPPKRIPIIPIKRLTARKKLQQKTKSTKGASGSMCLHQAGLGDVWFPKLFPSPPLKGKKTERHSLLGI